MTVLPSVGGILVDGVVIGGAIGPYLVGLGVSINIEIWVLSGSLITECTFIPTFLRTYLLHS